MSDVDAYNSQAIVSHLRVELEKARVREARAKQRVQVLERMLVDAEALASLDAPEETAAPRAQTAPAEARTVPAAQPTAGRQEVYGSWTKTIMGILTRAGHRMTYEEIKEEIGRTVLAERLRKSDKGFYSAVGKLTDRGRIVRHRGYLFSRAAFEGFQADVRAGRVEDRDAPAARRHDSPTKGAIISMLSVRPNGATTAEIVEALMSAPPPASDAVRKNKTVVYNLLSRMVKRDELARVGSTYLLPTQSNEPPTSDGGGSDPDGAATPSFEGRGQDSFLG